MSIDSDFSFVLLNMVDEDRVVLKIKNNFKGLRKYSFLNKKLEFLEDEELVMILVCEFNCCL